ncbi:MAG: hypothetical protein A2Y45_04260 [Tenericutes bacterium GWC2_34_14]|nr:MAG: hypothetical protein A2Z84_08155 [Tenericutes bacterium GWA2_35_7]OHE28815.1 MAG: hypothetical protein A2Y45_04260 [Tenericutes bacterium GWC2_34_14]OHE33283.1 MAG: hypothetical protein A2012_06040 [Tenericutes bacterium GWE2_34_108]OHE36433.1 MAG: hypothetical protein A2Y46_08145 [Tenericutes bacterium GWF1_35_14]OHE37637.1 MAG: hypothetical protein A2Y44_03070 [Tenericutes bacterium GWF2_35_184]OHE45086.1 MAG: hypothetical protein A2221_02440 [Tenericutes bacterium RIFOXYA2_FULL_36_3
MKKIMMIVGAIALVGLGFVLGSYEPKEVGDVEFTTSEMSEIELLSYTNSELVETFEETDSLEVFLSLHNELILKHQELKEKYSMLKTTRESLTSERQAFRALNVRLTREDGVILWTQYNDLLDLKDAHEETNGLAYQRLVDLKGLYTKENIDLIIQTYQEVLTVLNEREVLVDQAISIMNQSILVYQNYLI